MHGLSCRLLGVSLGVQEVGGVRAAKAATTFRLEVIDFSAQRLFIKFLHVIERISLETFASKITLTLSLLI